MLEYLEIHMREKKKKILGPDLTLFTKIEIDFLKWITDINVTCKTLKLLEENM